MDTNHRGPTAASVYRRLSRRRILQEGETGLAAALAPGLSHVAAQEGTPGREAATPVGFGTTLSEAML